MARVCRPGGRIGLANWTPEGFIGQMFKMLGKHVPPPAGVQPPSLWGDEGAPRDALRRPRAAIVATPRIFNFRYRSAAHFIDVVPHLVRPGAQGVRARCPPDKAAALERDLTELLNGSNRGGAGLAGRRRANTSRSSSPAADAFERVWSRACSAASSATAGTWPRAAYEPLWQAQLAPRTRADRVRGAGAGRARARRRVRHRADGAAGGARGRRQRRTCGRRRPVRTHGRRGARGGARGLAKRASRAWTPSAWRFPTPASMSRCARWVSCTCPIPRRRYARCTACCGPAAAS